MGNVLFTLDVVAPVFLTILLGYILKLRRVLNNDFVGRASTLIFYVGLPAAIITKMADADLRDSSYPLAVALFCGTTVLLFLIAVLLSLAAVKHRSRGAFVQGSFRGNLVIVGLPLLTRAMGEDAFTKAIVVLAVAMPLYNVLAVVALSYGRKDVGPGAIVRRVLLNPLVLAIVIGVAVSLLGIRLPGFVEKTGSYLGQMTFPLALLGIGAGMNRRMLTARIGPTLMATALNNVAAPLITVLVATAAGLPSDMIALLAILAATPTAVSSFIMARAMGADGDLAGSIVFISTAASVVTISGVILALRTTGLL